MFKLADIPSVTINQLSEAVLRDSSRSACADEDFAKRAYGFAIHYPFIE